MNHQIKVAIIGAGYAGMAAAVELAERGVSVTIFETSRQLGGRARAVALPEMTVDNGQHILIGAYCATLGLMKKVGANPEHLLQRLPLTLEYPGQLRIVAPRLPAPLHLAWALLCARGLNWHEKRAAIRFMQAMKSTRFRLHEDMTVTALLDQHQQPRRLREYLWNALCVAALNTPADEASAQVFLNVLRDTLASHRAASDLLLPRVDLGALFPEPAARHVMAQGGTLHRSTSVSCVTQEQGHFLLHGNHEPGSNTPGKNPLGHFTHVICAVAPYHLRTLLEPLPSLEDTLQRTDRLEYQPIVTCYLAYPVPVTLPQPMIGVAEGVTQWLFDRQRILQAPVSTAQTPSPPPGLLAAVISAHGRHLELSQAELTQRIHEEVRQIVHDLPQPIVSRVITEKRATWSCKPQTLRPAMTTSLPGLLLAGDYVESEYPGTIEGAVRSGVCAAHEILSLRAR